MINLGRSIGLKSTEELIDELMLSEPFCNHKGLKEKLLETMKINDPQYSALKNIIVSFIDIDVNNGKNLNLEISVLM